MFRAQTPAPPPAPTLPSSPPIPVLPEVQKKKRPASIRSVGSTTSLGLTNVTSLSSSSSLSRTTRRTPFLTLCCRAAGCLIIRDPQKQIDPCVRPGYSKLLGGRSADHTVTPHDGILGIYRRARQNGLGFWPRLSPWARDLELYPSPSPVVWVLLVDRRPRNYARTVRMMWLRSASTWRQASAPQSSWLSPLCSAT